MCPGIGPVDFTTSGWWPGLPAAQGVSCQPGAWGAVLNSARNMASCGRLHFLLPYATGNLVSDLKPVKGAVSVSTWALGWPRALGPLPRAAGMGLQGIS